MQKQIKNLFENKIQFKKHINALTKKNTESIYLK